MAGINVRVRAGETVNWGSIRQRATLAGDPNRMRSGDTRPLKELVALRGSQIEIPEMIELSSKLSIMRSEVTVGLFKQVMEGYEIIGHDANQLKAVLSDPKATGSALTYVSLLDAREFAKRLSEQTNRKFRVQTEAEWLQGRDKLSGNNWTWTETPYSSGTFVLRRLGVDFRDYVSPEDRYVDFAVRLVEDIK